MTRHEFLLHFRRCSRLETLEKVYEHLIHTRPATLVDIIASAYDHRKAELITGRLYDRVPAAVWTFVK
ncbi:MULTISPECIES: Hha/YmoA family nucleoid-associated regulatory protein [unclassified Erwinia]|uniref:Hha/YmoA family nucleoid-associated regulatory protein n=1 Tax=unclassified Erwinia TaxID=2622719 RepID=UPI000831906C|nr:Hha/YmoA family nucleoid-associated regulatory protein [Erwinia sp. ErVv1]